MSVASAGVVSTDQTSFDLRLDSYMIVGETYEVSLAMQDSSWGPSSTSELNTVGSSFNAPIAVSDDLQLTNDVRVQLIGTGFEVTEIKGGWQAVVPSAASVWVWTVTPRLPGAKGLLIAIENQAGLDGTLRAIPVRSYTKQVLVQERAWQWLTQASNWGYTYLGQAIMLLCTIMSGAVGFTQLQAYFQERKAAQIIVRKVQGKTLAKRRVTAK
jgi:hypothetical protein